MPIRDITNQTFGRLTALYPIPERKDNKVQWLCRCQCGTEKTVVGSVLRQGKVVSCGCYATEVRKKLVKAAATARRSHGMSGTPTFSSWTNMRKRCTYPKDPGFPRYGGRGVTVCDRWAESFEAFLEDMGERPEPHPEEGPYSIDRLDVDKGYSPDNCRWATALKQASNTSRNHFLKFAGKKMTITQWSRETGLSVGCIKGRLHMGWSIERALTTPKGHTGRPPKNPVR